MPVRPPLCRPRIPLSPLQASSAFLRKRSRPARAHRSKSCMKKELSESPHYLRFRPLHGGLRPARVRACRAHTTREPDGPAIRSQPRPMPRSISILRPYPRLRLPLLPPLPRAPVAVDADVDAVAATLGKIVELFPDSPMAEIAQRRLARINLEFKGLQATSEVKLGTYEQNIGLKYGRPRQ